jgi:hypothetical protein
MGDYAEMAIHCILNEHAMRKISTREYTHLVDIFGLGCVRLARLLKIKDGDGEGRLGLYLREGIDEAIRQVHHELRGSQKINVV